MDEITNTNTKVSDAKSFPVKIPTQRKCKECGKTIDKNPNEKRPRCFDCHWEYMANYNKIGTMKRVAFWDD